MKLKLIHGDCLEEMKKLPDRSIDLFLCDLPYGCLAKTEVNVKREGEYAEGGKAMSACAWDIKIDLEAFWIQVERLMKDDHTPIIHFCNTKFGYELIKSKEKWFRYDLVWNKSRGVGFLCANKMPLRSHENIYVFSKKGARYNRIDIEGDFKQVGGGRHNKVVSESIYGTIASTPIPDNEGRRCVKSVIEVNGVTRRGNHPTQKPDDLYKWLIERYSNPGDTILDPTAGSFASCFTAQALGRQAIGIEMNDAFYKKAQSLTKEE